MGFFKKKISAAFFSICTLCALAFAQVAPFDVSKSKRSSEMSSIEDLKNKLKKKKGEPSQEAYEMLRQIAKAEELIGEYDEAAQHYAKLASLVSEGDINDPKNWPKYVLNSARCTLFSGDAKTSKDTIEKILRANDSNIDDKTRAESKLLKVWCDIAEADGSYSRETNCISTLRYLKDLDEVAPVRPAILYTLCWLTNDKDEKADLLGKHPDSPEAALIRGDATLMPTALWFLTARKKDPKAAPSSQGAPAEVQRFDYTGYDDFDDYKDAAEPPAAEVADETATTIDTGIERENSAGFGEVAEAESPEVAPKPEEKSVGEKTIFSNPPRPSWVTSGGEQRGIVYTPMPTSPRPPVSPGDYSPEKSAAPERASTVETGPQVPPERPPERISIVPASSATPLPPKTPAQTPAREPAQTDLPKAAPQKNAGGYEPQIVYLSADKAVRKQRYQQVGYYRDEDNARRMATKLHDAGFEPVILARSPNGREIFYSVAVPDQNNVAEIHLKEAGFDSFTIVE